MNPNNYIEETIKNIRIGIAISDHRGLIKIVNNKFLDMFGYKKSEVDGLDMNIILEEFKELKDILKTQNEFTNREVYIHSRTNKLRFTLSMNYIDDGEGEGDIVYHFVDQKKERKLAEKIGANRAIYTFDKIIYRSDIFKRTIEFAKKISDSKSTVLITGETGTGKEIFAQSIHNHSPRKDKPFIAINAAAIPANLIESELFGYEEGAFTGAKKQGQAGKFEIADKGTIFLDEIGEMPLKLQTRLLRVIEEGIVSRVGSIEQTYVDVRIIAASNKDLKKEVENLNFREDLFYRLNVLPLRLAPLRDRKEDIPPLVEYFMERLSKRLNKRKVNIEESQMKILLEYDWPGNVRELENLIELLINLEYFPEDLLLSYKDQVETRESGEIASGKFLERECSLEEIEKSHIKYMLEKNKNNISLTASELGIGRNTLYRKIEKFDLA